MFKPNLLYTYGVNNAIIRYDGNIGIPVATIGINDPTKYPVSDGISLSPDGTKVFATLHNGNNEGFVRDSIAQFNLSTPWDLTTMSTIVGNTASLNSFTGYNEQAPFSNFFSPDGLNLYVVGGSFNRVYRYTVSTPFSCSTASEHSSYGLSGITVSGGLSFSQDGIYMFILGSGNILTRYLLSVAWDITTATVNGGTLTVTSQYSMHFKEDGKSIYILEGGPKISRYYLSIPWDLSSFITKETSPVLTPLGLTWGAFNGVGLSIDGTKFFVSNYSQNSVFSLTLTKPFAILGKLG